MTETVNFPLIGEAQVQNTLGEGILWDPRHNAFFWTDILESRLFKWGFDTQAIQAWDLPSRAGSLGLTEDPELLVVAFEEGIGLLSMEDGEIEWLFVPDITQKPEIRFNDGRVDPKGRFCAGTMNEKDEHTKTPEGALYQVDDKGKHAVLVENVGVSNGLSWSPCGTVMYFADSPTQTIYRFDYDPATGTASNRQPFATTQGDEYPDGAICDAEGNHWSAKWGGHRIVVYGPAGEIKQVLPMPVPQPTCLCIGGPNHDVLAVTSARVGLSEQTLDEMPSSGNVFLFQLPKSVGVADNYFVLPPVQP